jgi:predicted ATPase
MQTARSSVSEARLLEHPVSFCAALAWGTALSLKLGDLETAEQWATELDDVAAKHSLDSYYPSATGFRGQLSAKRGDVVTAVPVLRAAVNGTAQAGYYAFYTDFLSHLAQAESAAGHLDEGLGAIDQALQRSERTEELCYLPEVLRIKAELLLMHDKSNDAATENEFSRSLDWARRQGALSWELRTATSLARLRRDEGRACEARDLLAAVHGRFTEGLATADLKAAKRLLDELSRT